MPTPEVTAFRQSVVASADTMVHAGILSASQHGNISVLLPEGDQIVMTARSALANMRGDEISRLGLDGALREGQMDPSSREIIRMHTVVYEHRPDVRAVIHTHSPYATAFAVASRPIPICAEVLARWVGTEAIPVARYGPRGSEASVNNIVSVLRDYPAAKALLLEHHGVLVWGENVEQATRIAMAIEEGAQVALLASTLGPLRPIPDDGALGTLQRRLEFEQQGTLTAKG